MSYSQKTVCFRNVLIPVSFIIMKIFKVLATWTIPKSLWKIFLCRFEVCWQSKWADLDFWLSFSIAGCKESSLIERMIKILVELPDVQWPQRQMCFLFCLQNYLFPSYMKPLFFQPFSWIILVLQTLTACVLLPFWISHTRFSLESFLSSSVPRAMNWQH